MSIPYTLIIKSIHPGPGHPGQAPVGKPLPGPGNQMQTKATQSEKRASNQNNVAM